MREQLADGKVVFENQTRDRDKASKKIKSHGRALTTPETSVNNRLVRIQNAIKDKESKFYCGTDTLIVQDDPANFNHLRDLHQIVCNEVRHSLGASYRRIYINYGNNLKRVK